MLGTKKNNDLPQTNPVALKLTFKDVLRRLPSNALVAHQELITQDQLYRDGTIILEYGKRYKCPVKITYAGNKLYITTDSSIAVDVTGNIPAHDL